MNNLYHQFRTRMLLEGRLVAETALRVGCGRSDNSDPTAIDNEVIRDAYRRPYIPGSSFKGLWRNTAERLLGDWGKTDGEKKTPCDILGDTCLPQEQVKKLKDQYSGLELAKKIYQKLCPTCRLFGSTHFAGRIKVRELNIIKGSWVGFTEIRPGVAIDRDTRTAKDKGKYDLESVPAGTAFSFAAIVDNPDLAQWHNTLLTLLPFTHGDIPLGGSVSRGYGRVCLIDITVRQLDKETMSAFLVGGWDAILAVPLSEAVQTADIGGGNGCV